MHKSDVLRMIFKHLHELYTFNLPFRLKGTCKIHTKGLFKFHSNIFYSLWLISLVVALATVNLIRCLIISKQLQVHKK